MKTILLLSVIIIFTGCGKTLSVAPEFQSVVDEFNAAAASNNHSGAENLVIEFGDVSSKNAGASCYQDSGKTPRIAVDKTTWDATSDSRRKEMLFHEMGHCVLDRPHKEDRLSDGCKASFMSASPVGDWCANHHSDEYVTELFTH